MLTKRLIRLGRKEWQVNKRPIDIEATPGRCTCGSGKFNLQVVGDGTGKLRRTCKKCGKELVT